MRLAAKIVAWPKLTLALLTVEGVWAMGETVALAQSVGLGAVPGPSVTGGMPLGVSQGAFADNTAPVIGGPVGSLPERHPYEGFLAPPSVYRVPPDVPSAAGTLPRAEVITAERRLAGGMPNWQEATRAMTLSEVSWTYRAPTPPRVLKLHDIVVVVVDEKTQVISEGELDRRKTANAAWTLKDWVLLKGLSLIPDPQSRGDPKISGTVEQRFRAEGDFQSRGAMKFRIACEVVDIRPNGTLVVEGRRWLRNNDEIWEISLLGVVRPEDVLPNNTILSEHVANLRVYKREIGHVRDGFRRGWLTRIFDEYQPF